MSRILQKLDPRRSLTTAVAWLAVVLAMGVTLATMVIGDHTRQRLLAERDRQPGDRGGQAASRIELLQDA